LCPPRPRNTQQRILTPDARLLLPAPLVPTLLHYASNRRRALTWTSDVRHDISKFHAFLTIYVRYDFFCTAASSVRFETKYMIVDRPSGHINLFIRKYKGDQRRNDAEKQVLIILVKADTLLADLFEWYLNRRHHFCDTTVDCPLPTHVWSLPPFVANANHSKHPTSGPLRMVPRSSSPLLCRYFQLPPHTNVWSPSPFENSLDWQAVATLSS
jgi:hypothetical protein